MSTGAPTETPAKPIPLASDLLKSLSFKLFKITGLGISVNLISKQLPGTDLDPEKICPELVIPALTAELIAHADSCFEALEALEWLLATGADKKTEGASNER